MKSREPALFFPRYSKHAFSPFLLMPEYAGNGL